MKKTQRLLATAMTPILILQCFLAPLSVWADTLQVQPEATDYSDGAASSSKDEGPVLNIEQQGVEVEQPTVSDDDSPSSVSSESTSNATDSAKPENDVSTIFGSVSYQTHVQDIGWQAPVSNGMTAGTTGRAKRVEALKINLLSQDGSPLGNDSISVQSHISGIGWESQPVGNGQTSGTVGQSRAIEAIKLSLSGGLSDSYDIWYRVHSANVGWLGWASNGEPAGTQGYAYQIEAIQIKVLPKNAQDAPARGDAFRDHSQEPPTVSYRSHVSNVGWMGTVADGKTSGVIDSRNAIEALSLGVNWYGHGGSISSRAHVSGIGWQDWSSGVIGTTGQSRSIEAVQFKLNGELSAAYDIWYRVYASKLGGWLGWTSNGSPAGSVGKGAAIQGVQILLVEKSGPAPGNTLNHFIGATDVLNGSSLGLNGKSLGSEQGKSILLGSENGSEPLTSLSISFDNQEILGSIDYSGFFEFGGWSGAVSDGAALNSKNDGLVLKAVRLALTGDLSKAYDVWYRCFDSKKGWLGWACNGSDAGATISGSFLKAVEVRIISKGSGAPGVTDGAFASDTSADCAHVVYQAHSANRGWSPSVLDGQDAGTTGQSLSLQALNVSLSGVDDDSQIEARAHVANIGWQEWQSAGYVGTVGQGLAIQALELRLNGSLANQYDIYYRVHSAGYGWLGWAKNGDSAGTTGLNIQIEAVQIKLVAKGRDPGASSVPAFISVPALTLQAHVATLGWMNPVGNGGVAGTTGRSLAIEALKLNISSSVSGGIEYSAHVQDVGWQSWASNGDIAGTVGRAKRIEAIKIRLTGDLSNYFDVWYRAYCQDFGWLDWTSNGQPAGTSRIGCRVESVQVKIVPKGAGAPGATGRPFTDQPLLPADMMAMLNLANRYSSNTSWLIAVDRQTCRLGVLRGQRGSWSYAQYWTCSTGAPSTPTPTGEYSVTGKGYSFGHGYTCYYYTQFYGDYLFHSIPYYQGTFNPMDSRIGMHISQGCVRLPIDRAKWIWDNVPLATKVVIY